MKTLLMTALLLAMVSGASGATFYSDIKNDKEKKDKKKKDRKSESVRNFHSVNKWMITIDYENGERISKTIVVDGNGRKSALEMAFAEAEKYLKRSRRIKDFQVTPVSSNSYVLLAGGE